MNKYLYIALITFLTTPSTAQRINLNPKVLDFGTVVVGYDSLRQVTLINSDTTAIEFIGGNIVGSSTFRITRVQSTQDATPPFWLLPGDSIVGTILFSPESTEKDSAFFEFNIGDSAGGDTTLSYKMVGVGIENESTVDHKPSSLATATVIGNPVTNACTIELQNVEPQHVNIELFDVGGSIVLWSYEHELATGRNLVTLPISNLPSGAYRIIVSANAQILASTNVIVLH